MWTPEGDRQSGQEIRYRCAKFWLIAQSGQMTSPLDSYIENQDISSWSDFEAWIDLVSNGERMAYRGQEDCSLDFNNFS
jgi:hypothetical protein